MQHQCERGCPPQPARVGRELGECRRDRAEQRLVERSRALPDESIRESCGSVNTRWKYGTGNTSRWRAASQASLARVWHRGQCRLRQE